jgi:hypothetical protein
MKAGSTSKLLCLLSSAVLLAGCESGSAGRASADDAAVHQDLVQGKGGVEVTFNATVLEEPTQVGDHEHLLVADAAGDRLEVDHNIKLATAVPAHKGDRLLVHGRLYIDPGPRAGVHCTHAHTTSGCPVPGWIELAGQYYE